MCRFQRAHNGKWSYEWKEFWALLHLCNDFSLTTWLLKILPLPLEWLPGDLEMQSTFYISVIVTIYMNSGGYVGSIYKHSPLQRRDYEFSMGVSSEGTNFPNQMKLIPSDQAPSSCLTSYCLRTLLLFFFISWRLITFQYCSGFCHTLTWISHGFTCIPHPDPPSHLPLYLLPLGLPSAPGLSTCLMHPTWAGDLFHPRYTCFNADLLEHPTLAFSHRVQKSVLYICVPFSVLHIGLSSPSF